MCSQSFIIFSRISSVLISISFEGSSITGLLDSDTAKVIKEYLSCYKYIPQSVCTVKKDKVASMEVTLNSVVHHIEFKENGYTLDGRDCDSESFEAFFKKLSGIVSSSVSDTAAATGPDSESFIVTYHFKDSSYPDAQAVYTPFDENYYTASSGEIKGRLVNRRSVESVISLFETVKQSN